MKLSRKDFFKKTCLAGACFCGFSSFTAQAVLPSESEKKIGVEEDSNLKFIQDWISSLLLHIDENSSTEECKKMVKPCSSAHYDFLEMDKLLSPYVGNVESFIQFIQEKWGWKIKYEPVSGLILADENKNQCVCPLVNKDRGVRSSILCYCSEGFAEKMFSKVVGKPVNAEVISSIHRGDKTCQYQIKF